MKKIVTVIGARPQFIKASVVSRAILHSTGIREVIVHTGQHFDKNMSEVFFAELGIQKPDYFLDIHSGSHGAMTGRMLAEVEQVLFKEKPDIVLVYGDTNSTLAGALAAAKLHISVAHVESGLRSFNRKMPEEQNRIVTDHLADILFTPTAAATEQLLHEGIASVRIHQVGDVMYDAALYFGNLSERRSNILNKLHFAPKKFVLATVHRAENTDNPERLREIIGGLEAVAQELMPVLLPLHPRTKESVMKNGIIMQHVCTVDPVGYLDMVMLERSAAVIATDSGGVQKEAYFHGVPCVTLRDETEWRELVDAGWNRLVNAQAEVILAAIRKAISTQGKSVALYGNGNSAQKIVRALE